MTICYSRAAFSIAQAGRESRELVLRHQRPEGWAGASWSSSMLTPLPSPFAAIVLSLQVTYTADYPDSVPDMEVSCSSGELPEDGLREMEDELKGIVSLLRGPSC